MQKDQISPLRTHAARKVEKPPERVRVGRGAARLTTAPTSSATTEHFKTFEVITADDDGQAVEIAKKFVDGHDVEVWNLD
jgi:hypothetical protein